MFSVPRPPWRSGHGSGGVHPRSSFSYPADIHSLPTPSSGQPLALSQDDPETCRPPEPERGAFQAISLPLLSSGAQHAAHSAGPRSLWQ